MTLPPFVVVFHQFQSCLRRWQGREEMSPEFMNYQEMSIAHATPGQNTSGNQKVVFQSYHLSEFTLKTTTTLMMEHLAMLVYLKGRSNQPLTFF